MNFCIITAFDNIELSKEKKYAIQISDTLIVTPANKPNIVITNEISSKYEDISYSLDTSDKSNSDLGDILDD